LGYTQHITENWRERETDRNSHWRYTVCC